MGASERAAHRAVAGRNGELERARCRGAAGQCSTEVRLMPGGTAPLETLNVWLGPQRPSDPLAEKGAGSAVGKIEMLGTSTTRV